MHARVHKHVYLSSGKALERILGKTDRVRQCFSPAASSYEPRTDCHVLVSGRAHMEREKAVPEHAWQRTGSRDDDVLTHTFSGTEGRERTPLILQDQLLGGEALWMKQSGKKNYFPQTHTDSFMSQQQGERFSLIFKWPYSVDSGLPVCMCVCMCTRVHVHV